MVPWFPVCAPKDTARRGIIDCHFMAISSETSARTGASKSKPVSVKLTGQWNVRRNTRNFSFSATVIHMCIFYCIQDILYVYTIPARFRYRDVTCANVILCTFTVYFICFLISIFFDAVYTRYYNRILMHSIRYKINNVCISVISQEKSWDDIKSQIKSDSI